MSEDPTKTYEFDSALSELQTNAHLYTDLITALHNRRTDPVGLLTASVAAGQEAVKDVRAIVPVLKPIADLATQGAETSEYKLANNLNQVLLVITFLAPAIDALVASLQHSSFGNSAWVSGLAMVLKAVVSVSYTNSRTKVKTSMS